LGGRKGIRLVKTEWWGAGMVICLERRADLHMAQLMPLPLTVSCFSKIQIGFTFLVPACPGSPGKRAVKRVYVCMYVFACIKLFNHQVAPAELEAVLVSHFAVQDAAVISRPSERLGELPTAFVVLKPDHSTTQDELQQFIAGKLISHLVKMAIFIAPMKM